MKKKNDEEMRLKCANMLLARTFILQDLEEDRSLYLYMTDGAGYREVADLLEPVGWDVNVRKEYGLISISPTDAFRDKVGMREPYVAKPQKTDVVLTLLLFLKFQENFTSKDENVITFQDLLDSMEEWHLLKKYSGRKTEIKTSLVRLKDRKLIDFKISDLDNADDEMPIRLLSSLLFSLPETEMARIAEDGLKIEEENVLRKDNG